VLDNSIIDFTVLVQSAKNELILWGLTDAQIQALAFTKATTPVTSFYSPVAGYSTTLDIREGEYKMEDGTIVRITDLLTLWAKAQVYSFQLLQIDNNAVAPVQFPDLPDKKINGKIEFSNPELNSQSCINLLRVNVAKPGNILKLGMPAFVIIKGKHQNSLTLPPDAIIRTGTGASVWVQTGQVFFKI